ncbi:MAG: hypothetical protein HKN47_15905 [Pirellulaceae bacterium]|nr:hypothetical protein [Pirellulaceae bacterium]
MVVPSPPSVTVASADGLLRVEFHWNGDRYGHRFVLPDGQTVASVEGDAESAWPPSPPLQQLSLEEINGAPVVLGVGAAGTSHWSISVEQREQGLRFDFACRSKSPVGWIGCSYRISDRLEFVAEPESAVAIGPDETLRISPRRDLGDGTGRWAFLALPAP